jgi:hypothetical protein
MITFGDDVEGQMEHYTIFSSTLFLQFFCESASLQNEKLKSKK